MGKTYRKAQKKSIAIFDWILILGLVITIYIVAEELIFKVAEKTNIPVWMTGFAVAAGLVIGLVMLKHAQFPRNVRYMKPLIYAGLIGGLLLSIYIVMEELIYYLAELARWEIAVSAVIGLFLIGSVRYFGRKEKFINRVAGNI